MRARAVETLPYAAAFAPGEYAVIEAALLEAAAALQLCDGIDLATCAEVEITVQLENILNRMLESKPSVVKGFSKALFQTVVRGAEVCTHDLSMPEKRPDLTFRSQRALPKLQYPQHCALFVECKIVDRTHPPSRYCSNGITRFVEGVYAWAAPSALMIAYTRNGRSLVLDLKRVLEGNRRRYALASSLQTASVAPGVSRGISVHTRDLPKLKKGAAGNIRLTHLWFDLDELTSQ